MTKHKPVLLKEAVDALQVKPGGIYIDVTLGGGGHSKLILQQMNYTGSLVAIDLDKSALQSFEAYMEESELNNSRRKSLNLVFVNDNFRNLDQILRSLKITQVDGIIADLGLSTDQIYEVKGISYLKNEQLDMRINKNLTVTAADLLNALYKKELTELFEKFADIDFAKELVKEILRTRQISPFKTTSQLKHLIQKVVPLHTRRGTRRNPEAKVFQALRIAVNDELESLATFLPLAFEALATGGRLAVISFHSGEDRIVKSFIKEKSKTGQGIVVEKLLRPSQLETTANPRSASAKLRVIEKRGKN